MVKMNDALIWLVFVAVMVTCVTGSTSGIHKYLFNASTYNKDVRPAPDPNKPINVTFGLSLHEIIDLNDKHQRLDLRITILEYWTDASLSWNKTQFGGVESITVHPDDIWLPDIVLYNNAGEGFGDGVTRTEALIRHDGLVTMNIPSISRSTCKVHLENYPFDQQICRIKFGSWSYDADMLKLNLQDLSADLTSFISNVEWELLEVPVKFSSTLYACCANPFEDLEYAVKIKRRSLFHAMYTIIPCAVISFLTLLVFLLPPDCNERMTVGMAILVGLSFFFLIVAENMPATSDTVPVIGTYYSVTMLEVSSAFFMTCFVQMCHHHNPMNGDLPDWGRKYLQFLSRFLGFPFSFTKPKETSNILDGNKNIKAVNGVKNGSTLTQRTNSASSSSKETGNHKDADKILHELIDNEELMEKRRTNWRMAALVLNSVFMWIYVFAVIVTLSVLILSQMITSL